MSHAVVDSIEQRTRDITLRAGDPAYHAQIEERHADRAGTLLEATGEVPFNPQTLLSHKVAQETIADGWIQVTTARQECAEATRGNQEALLARSTLAAGWSPWQHGLVILACVIMALLVASAIAELLQETICNYIKMGFFYRRYKGNELFDHSLRAARASAYLLAGTVALLPTLSCLITRGRLGKLKWALVVPELLFAVGFGMLRLYDPHTKSSSLPMMVAYSLFEIAVALLHILCLIAVSAALRRAERRACALRRADETISTRAQLLTAAQRRLADAEARHHEHVAAVQTREEDHWRRPLLAELARCTARLTYDTATQEIAGTYLEEKS